jgi:hypothetical protein
VIEGDAVGSDEDTCAVFAKFAVDKNFLRRNFAKESEKFSELSGTGSGEAADGKENEVNAEGFCLEALLIARVGKFTAQIDDGGDAEFFEFGKTGKMRLRAAKKMIGNFSGVGNARERDFLGGGRRGRSVESRRLAQRNGVREERKGESEEERKKSHSELARKSLGGRGEKEKEKGRGTASETAPQDIGIERKSYLDFAIFS